MQKFIEQKSTTAQIVSLTEVQQYLNNSNTSLTSFLTNCISYVQKTFETYCQKSLVETSVTGVYDGNGTSTLYLNTYPIISVTGLQYKTEFAGTWTNYGSYYVYTDNIELYNELFSLGKQNIKVIYTAGYQTIPSDIKKIALEAVTEIYKESGQGNNRLGLNSTSVSEGNNYSESYQKLFEQHKLVLDFYKKAII